jgi:hypothetical protein
LIRHGRGGAQTGIKASSSCGSCCTSH